MARQFNDGKIPGRHIRLAGQRWTWDWAIVQITTKYFVLLVVNGLISSSE
jgi:hypothetical protein